MRVARAVIWVVVTLASLLAGCVLYLSVEASWGPWTGLVVVVLALAVWPMAFARVRLREEEAWRPMAPVLKWSRFVLGCGTLAFLFLISVARVSPGEAFRAMPARHPELGFLSRAAANLGEALAPAQVEPAPPPSAEASASASASAAPPAPSASN
jgi:hypothetical protein